MKVTPFDPEPVEVVPVNGLPTRVTYRKRRQKVGRVVNIWRVDDSWWVKPVVRIYYTLELEGGSRITIFQDLPGGLWYRQNWIA